MQAALLHINKSFEIEDLRILLFLDKEITISEIANLLEVDRQAFWRIRKRYLEEGLDMALREDSRSGQPLK